MAKKFYDVLILHGYTDAYPWTGATTAAANDALANLGQLKNLFSFDLTRASDGDGISDGLETKFNLNPFNAQTNLTLPQPPPPPPLLIGVPNDWQGWTRIGRSDDPGVYGSGSISSSALYDVYANQFYLNAASGASCIPVGNQYVTGDPTGLFTYSPGAFTGENRILGIGVQGLPGSNVSGFTPTVKFALGDNTYSAATSVPGTDGRVSFSLYSHPGDFTVQFQPVEFAGSQIYRPSNITFRGNDGNVYTLPGGIGSGASYDFAFRAIPLTSSNSYQMFFDLTAMQSLYSNVSLFQATFKRPNVMVAPGTNYYGQGIDTIGSKLTIAFNGLPNNTTVFCVDAPPRPPVEFKGNKKNLTTRLDQFPEPIGGLEYHEYDSNLFIFADGRHAWSKVTCVLWNDAPRKIDLIDHVQGADRATLEATVDWVVNGQAQASSEISMGLKPDDNLCRPFYVKMVPKGGGNAIDHLIITLVPPETKTKFDAWYAAESTAAGKAWFAELPPMPTALEVAPALLAPDRNYPAAARLYYGPTVQGTYMHPDARFELRSYPTPGGHAHQVCFTASGGLILAGVSAGSADKQASFSLTPPIVLNPLPHVAADVTPFVWSLQLDGNPCIQAGTGLAAKPMLYEGENIGKYFECRPAVPNNKQRFVPGSTP